MGGLMSCNATMLLASAANSGSNVIFRLGIRISHARKSYIDRRSELQSSAFSTTAVGIQVCHIVPEILMDRFLPKSWPDSYRAQPEQAVPPVGRSMGVEEDGDVAWVKLSCAPVRSVSAHQHVDKTAELFVAAREVRI